MSNIKVQKGILVMGSSDDIIVVTTMMDRPKHVIKQIIELSNPDLKLKSVDFIFQIEDMTEILPISEKLTDVQDVMTHGKILGALIAYLHSRNEMYLTIAKDMLSKAFPKNTYVNTTSTFVESMN